MDLKHQNDIDIDHRRNIWQNSGDLKLRHGYFIGWQYFGNVELDIIVNKEGTF